MDYPFRLLWPSKPQKIELKIQELSHEKAKPGDRHCWRVRISLHEATEESTKELKHWECVIEDPFNRPERLEVQEYFNIVIKPDAIDDEVASKISRNLDRYRKSLFECLKLRECLSRCKGKEIEVRIREMEASERHTTRLPPQLKRSVQSLHWEHLEDISLWSKNSWGFQSGPISVNVQRFFRGRQERLLSPLGPTTTANRFRPIKILLVVARTHIHENENFDLVSPTSVLCSILKAQQELENQFSPNRIQLEVVRPGTFEEFKASLLRCERKGKHHAFQIVHFDMHGGVSQANAAFLEFNEYDLESRKLRPSRFDSQAIAEQLIRFKIDCVVLGSCKTAVADAGLEANFSTDLVKRGVASVVAMSYNIPDSMLQIFFSRFYQEIFVDGREVAHAVAVARKELRQNPGRWSYENQRRVDIQDWFVPKYYSNGQPLRIDTALVPRSRRSRFLSIYTLVLIISILGLLWRPQHAARTSTDNLYALMLCCSLYAVIFMGQWWTKLRSLKILKSIDHDRKNILRLEGDLQRCHKVFLNAWNDVEATAPNLVTALSEIWRRTHWVQHCIVIQAYWFIHPLDIDTQDWPILLTSCAHLLRLWRLESSPGLQRIVRANGSDIGSAEPRTVVIIDNVNALFPEDLHRKAYHVSAQKRFYDWIERYFGTESIPNTSQNPNYLILIGNFVQETVEEWFKATHDTSSVLASSILTEYINPKKFPHRTEGVATGRSWLG